MRSRGKKLTKDDVPEHFDEHTIATLNRIEGNLTVIGFLFIRNDVIDLNSMPEVIAQTISTKLPALNTSVKHAVTEIKIICSDDRNMKIMNNLLKDKRDEWLVATTAMINKVNPMVDRIMNDESVGGVVMTNKEGAPILTNTNLMTATQYGSALQRLGALTQTYIKDMNPLDEVLVLRINTKKIEMMVAPHTEFTIIVTQQSSHRSVHKKQ